MKFLPDPTGVHIKTEPNAVYSERLGLVRVNTQFGAYEFSLDELIQDRRIRAAPRNSKIATEIKNAAKKLDAAREKYSAVNGLHALEYTRYEELVRGLKTEIEDNKRQIRDLQFRLANLREIIEHECAQKFRRKAMDLIKEVVARARAGDKFEIDAWSRLFAQITGL